MLLNPDYGHIFLDIILIIEEGTLKLKNMRKSNVQSSS